MMCKNFYKNESGYIVVETVGSFIMFVLLVISILSLVNIVTLQSRVHYALTQTAITLSMYCHIWEVTGQVEKIQEYDNPSSKTRQGTEAILEEIDSVIDSINSISKSLGSDFSVSRNRPLGAGEDIADKLITIVRLLIDYGGDAAASLLFEQLVRPLVGRYLSNGNLTGDEYLRSVNVVDGLSGLHFTKYAIGSPIGGSSILDANSNVRIVVTYDIEYSFGVLRLPFRTPVLRVSQAAVTGAWLNGRGEGYW
jgi:hypothetical protein